MQKIESLQSLRAIAFIIVFLGHCGVDIFVGAFGVSIFIILSGFCMQLSYERHPIENISPKSNFLFAYRKIIKLYPLHLFMLLCCLILTKFRMTPAILWHLFLIQSWSADARIYFAENGVAWYLSTYMFLCLVAPWILVGINKLKKKKRMYMLMCIIITVMFFVGYISSQSYMPQIGDNVDKWIGYVCPLYRVGDFTLGICLGRLCSPTESKKLNKVKYTLYEFFAVLLSFSLAYFHNTRMWDEGLRFTFLFIPGSLILVYLFYRCEGLITKLLTNRFLLFVADISAYTYLIHQQALGVIDKLLVLFSVPFDRYIRIPIAFITSIVSALIFIKVEKFIKTKTQSRSSKSEI